MSTGTLFGLITLLLMLLFVGIWAWAWSRKRRKTFERAAQMPLEDDDTAPGRKP
ncbi:MAG TPA: cbb3-type cytochrome c oxidase subunit 3 [Steroidobacteraceae bacterium]|jgi:cytochrome c oxidase cbb3-type subunit 4|nr:cbb3-type cytochrome c oxidase subunit 3 [Steroidobacteraceae bacterium]